MSGVAGKGGREVGDVSAEPRSCCGCSCLNYDISENHASHSVSDEWDASMVSQWTFQWLQPLVSLGSTRPLEFSDLGELSVLDKSHRLRRQFVEALAEERKLDRENQSLWRVLRVSFGDLLYPALAAKVVGDLLAFVQPLALGGIIDYIAAVQDGTEEDSELGGLGYGWWWSMALVVSAILQNALLQNHHHLAMRAGMRVRAAIQSAVYAKTLTIASAARELAGVGRLVNLASTDAVTIHMVPYFISYVVASPMQIVITGALLVWELGAASLVGMVTLLALVPVQRYLGGIIKSLSAETLSKSDSRVKLVTEIIQGIKLLRMFAWEDSFDDRVTSARDQELVAKRSAAIVTGFNAFITDAAPVIVALLSFVTYSYTSDEDLNARQAFTALTLFGLLRLPLLVLPMLNDAIFRAQASVERVQGFLDLPDSEEYVDYVRDSPLSWSDGSTRPAAPSPKAGGAVAETSDAAANTSDNGASQSATAAAFRPGIEFKDAQLAWTVEELRRMKKAGIDVLTGKKSEQPAASTKQSASAGENSAGGGKPKTGGGPDWDFKLRVPDLQLPAGKLTTVIGSIGTGKSSMLAALLGEMTLEKGSITVHLPREHQASYDDASTVPVSVATEQPAAAGKAKAGRNAYEIAYCAQSAWIMSGTIRDNILFGLPFEREWYDTVIDACCLKSDLERNFVAGDKTEVGERGITCSGGQKARISLARAVYSRAPVVLLDDVLSAVDAHVGARMFREAICGLLKGRTVVFVSHQVQFLPMSDHVVLMDGGSPAASGTFDEVMASSEEVAKIMDFSRVGKGSSGESKDAAGEQKAAATDATGGVQSNAGVAASGGAASASVADEDDVVVAVAQEVDSPAKQEDAPPKADKAAKAGSKDKGKESKAGSLTKDEHRERGQVSLAVYWSYLSAMSGTGVFLIFGLLVLLNALRVATDWWLTRWSTNALDESLGFYASIYAGLSAGNVLSILAHELMWAWAAMIASQQLHSDMFRRVIKAIGRWFDITPSGRIQNRFGSDVEVVDKMLPLAFSNYLKLAVQISVTLVVQTVITWQVVLGFAPLFVVYYFLQDFYRKSSRECKRLEAISKSPIYNHLQETLGGLETVRSGGHAQRFEAQMAGRIDDNSVAFFKLNLMNRWLGLRLDVIGGIIVGVTAIAGVATAGDVDPGLVGLSITYAFAVVGQLNWLLRFSTDTEVHMASVERMIEYSQVPIEKPHVYEAGDSEGGAAPEGWPSQGKIEFKNVRMRYNPEDPSDPLVLNGMTLSLPAQSRIGVVGPTGAGKSSILVALFRYVELVGGSIEIDGIDVSRIGLRQLRRAITVIPQDPVLFHETVAYNLDPTGDSTPKQMQDAVDTVHLTEAVQRLGGLEGTVTEGGKNLSAGQRQLFCLARALLRKSKILALDEATSSISKEDDELVQRMLREQFQGVTTITIAHRINTITSSDYILAMRNGKVAEFAPPAELMQREDSLYRSLLTEQARAESR